MESNRNRVMFVGGLSLYWPIFRDVFFQSMQVSSEATNSSGFFYLFYLICVVLAVLAAIVLHFRGMREAYRLLVPCGAVSAVLILACNLPFPFELVMALRFFSMLFCAISFLLLTIGWFVVAGCMEPASRLMLMAISFLLSFLVSLLAFLPLPFVVIWPILTWLMCPIALRVLVSRFCAVGIDCFADEFELESCSGAAASSRLNHAPDGAASPAVAGNRGLLMLGSGESGLVLLLILFLLIGAIARGLMKSGQIMTETSLGDSVAACAVSIALALSVIVILHASRQQNRKLLLSVLLPVLVFLLGLLVASIANFAVVGGQVVVVGRTFMMFFLFAVLADGTSSNERLSLQREGFAASLFAATDVLSGFLSYAVVPTMTRLAGVSYGKDLGILALVACFVLIAGTMFVLVSFVAEGKEGVLARGAGKFLPDESDARKAVCDEVAQEYALTQRETELLLLLSRGFSQKRIAEELFISTSTEQSHAKALYRKLGVHSKQEIIDFVASRMEDIVA